MKKSLLILLFFVYISGYAQNSEWKPLSKDARTGHGSMVYSAVFSPDAKYLASYDQAGTIVVSDLAAKRVLYTIEDTEREGYQEPIYSPNGKILAAVVERRDDPTVLLESSIKFWDAATGKPIGTLEGSFRMIDEMIFSPDSATFYASIDQKSTVVWDTSSLKMNTKRLPIVGPYSFNVSGTILAASSPDRKKAVLLNSKTGTITRAIPGFTFVASVAFEPAGRFLALNDEEEGGMRLKVFNLATGRRIMGFDNVDQHPTAAFFANGRSVVLVQFEKNFADEPLEKSRIGALYDPATGKKQKDLIVDFPLNGFGTTFSNDGRFLAVRSSSSVTNTVPESSIKVIDISTGTLAASISGYRREATSLMFSGDGRELFSAHPDGRLIAWNTKSWDPVRSMAVKADETDFDPALLPGTAFFTSAKLAKTYDMMTGKAVADSTDEPIFKTYQAVSSDGRLFLIADEGKLSFYSIPRLELRNSIPSPLSDEALSTTSFALDRTGSQLAYGSDSSLTVLDTGTGKQIIRVPVPKGTVSDIAYSENGRYIAMANSEDASVTSRYTINVIDKTTRSIVFKQDSDNPGCAFSSDSSSIATLNRSDRLELHSIPEGRLISESKVPIQRLSKPIYFAFHPKERLLAVGTEYGIHVFNTESGVQVARLK